LEKLHEVSPFSYRIGGPTGFIDDLKIDSGLWDAWFSSVRDLNIKIIPTIAWFDGDGIYSMLSSAKSRQAEEDKITALVTSHKYFDGIDIDFEAMLPKTQPYFSLFIKGLAIRLHPQHKLLTCTVQTHTPLAELYDTIPTKVTYAENYAELNKYCDEIRIMAYDQQTIDLKLNRLKGNGSLYSPIADTDWVESVIKETLKTVSKSKLVLGVPTYGYEYEVSWYGGVTTYERVRAFDYLQARDRADQLGIEPQRNNAGELGFTFTSSTYIARPAILVSTVPSVMPPPELAKPVDPNAKTTFFVSFPDAQSIQDKITLAKKYGIHGIVLFKADGDIDPLVWEDMK
jgi:spore germination protein YaaH